MEYKIKAHSLLTDYDIYLMRSGKHIRLYEKMGSHLIELDGEQGCYFAVYAPAAKSVSVVGNFNGWVGDDHMLFPRWDKSGIWKALFRTSRWAIIRWFGSMKAKRHAMFISR